MINNLFSKAYLTIFALVVAQLTACSTTSQAVNEVISEPTVATTQSTEPSYITLTTQQDTLEAGKIEVLIFFGYQCHHCHQFYQSALKQWQQQKPKDVNLVLVPTLWAGQTVYPAVRAYLTSSLIGRSDTMHEQIFEIFQKDKSKLATQAQLAELAQNCCQIPQELFNQNYHSPQIDQLLVRDINLVKNYAIKTTPTIVVNGRYLITLSSAGDYNNMILLMNKLITQERELKTPIDERSFSTARLDLSAKLTFLTF